MDTPKNIRMVIGLIGQTDSDHNVIKEIQNVLGEGAKSHHILLSDMIRESPQTRGKQDSDTLREIGNKLRLQYGTGAWVKRLLIELPKNKREGVLIIDTISNPGEIDMLRGLFGERVLIMATDSIQKRQQKEIEAEDRRWYGSDLRGCLEKADFISDTKKSEQERLAEISEVVSRFSRLVETKENDEPRREIREGRRAA